MRGLRSIQKAQVLVAVLLVLLAAAAVFKTNELKPSVLRAQWTDVCNNYVTESHANDWIGAARLDPVDRSLPIGPVWLVDWAGITLPIPAVDYTKVVVDRGHREGLLDLTLSGEGVSIKLRWLQPEEPRGVGIGHETLLDVYHTDAGRDAMARHVGAHMTSRGPYLARTHSLDEISCEEGREDPELPTLVSLMVYSKQLRFSPGPSQFDVPGAAGEFLGGTAKRLSSGRWEVVVFQPDAAVPPAVIRYEVASDLYAEIGHHVASEKSVPTAEQPPWLSPVNTLLADLTSKNVEAVGNAFNRSAVDPSSRLSLAELQRVLDGEKPWESPSSERKAEIRKANEVVF
jgi:hypothetical protein